MKPIRFVVVKSRSMRNLLSLRLLNKNGQPMEFSLQEEMTKSGAKEGDIVVLARETKPTHCNQGYLCIQGCFVDGIWQDNKHRVCTCSCYGCRP